VKSSSPSSPRGSQGNPRESRTESQLTSRSHRGTCPHSLLQSECRPGGKMPERSAIPGFVLLPIKGTRPDLDNSACHASFLVIPLADLAPTSPIV
jgi:hypothetical protein